MVNSISDDQAPNPKEELYTQWPLLWDQGSNHCQQMAANIYTGNTKSLLKLQRVGV